MLLKLLFPYLKIIVVKLLKDIRKWIIKIEIVVNLSSFLKRHQLGIMLILKILFLLLNRFYFELLFNTIKCCYVFLLRQSAVHITFLLYFDIIVFYFWKIYIFNLLLPFKILLLILFIYVFILAYFYVID